MVFHLRQKWNAKSLAEVETIQYVKSEESVIQMEKMNIKSQFKPHEYTCTHPHTHVYPSQIKKLNTKMKSSKLVDENMGENFSM